MKLETATGGDCERREQRKDRAFPVLASSAIGRGHATGIPGVTRRTAFRRICAALFLVPLVPHVVAQQGGIKRQPVESSVLAAVGYDAQKRLLEIEFRSGAIYRYFEVQEEIHRRLLAAESKGHFFGANIRDKFRSERVKPPAAK